MRRRRSRPSNRQVLGSARDLPCRRCGQQAHGWHHRVPESLGGPTDHMNCIPLCGHGTAGCHGWVEHHPQAARDAGLSVGGTFLRGRYIGPDGTYHAHYNLGATDHDEP